MKHVTSYFGRKRKMAAYKSIDLKEVLLQLFQAV